MITRKIYRWSPFLLRKVYMDFEKHRLKITDILKAYDIIIYSFTCYCIFWCLKLFYTVHILLYL